MSPRTPGALPKVLICCGSGGVGKTTTSAAAAVRFAREGERVAVLTIDPARRLADALGIQNMGNIHRVPVNGPGSVDALMLDAKGTFDEVVCRYAPNPDAERRILQNHYYRYVSERLAGVHEYMAMERLLQLATHGQGGGAPGEGGPYSATGSRRTQNETYGGAGTGEGDRLSSTAQTSDSPQPAPALPYDCLVLDTPPARHALDFLEAPARMARLMDEGVMRWLTLPGTSGGWRMIERGSEVLAKVLNNLLGEGTIQDIAEFFSAFQTLWEGFRERSLRVEALLSSPQTRFVLVSTPSPAARADALVFLQALQSRKKRFSGFVLNRCLLSGPPGAPDFGDPPEGADPRRWERLTAALARLPDRHGRLVAAQEEAIRALTASASARIWRLPEWEEIHIGGLSELQRIEQLSHHLPRWEDLG